MTLISRIGLASLAAFCLAIPAVSEEQLQTDVDRSFSSVARAVEDAGLTPVLSIDHARLAAAEGVEMPPARVQLFSDARLNALILQENLRAGLDLPFRALSYAENGGSALAYTSGAFLAQRHALATGAALSDFDDRIATVLADVEDVVTHPVAVDGVTQNFGIIELVSPFSVAETVARLKSAVTAQSDTIWFGEIDFRQEAKAHGVEVKPAQLLLFGGPAPGGVAMAEYPSIGLDAFCQKLLVYADEDDKTIVLYNDIAALAELHYGQSAKPHAMLNKRLTETFTKAISE